MKKSKMLLLALLALLGLSAVGCLFSFAYVSLKDWSRQSHLKMFRNFESQENKARLLAAEYHDWQTLPHELHKFKEKYIRSMDEFAGFRRDLDSYLAANGLQPSRIDLNFGSLRNGIRRVTLKFFLEGSYRNLKKFIFDMEAKEKMHYFSSIQLSASAGQVKGTFMMEVCIGE